MLSHSEQIAEAKALRRDQDRAFARLGGVAPSLDEQRALADTARQLEELYRDLELTIPEPGPTDAPLDYRTRLLVPLQKFSSPELRRADLPLIARSGGARAIAGLDQWILADARRVAADRTVGSFLWPGRLRQIVRVDEGRHTITSFHGSPLAWMSSFMPPVRLQVEGFLGQRQR